MAIQPEKVEYVIMQIVLVAGTMLQFLKTEFPVSLPVAYLPVDHKTGIDGRKLAGDHMVSFRIIIPVPGIQFYFFLLCGNDPVSVKFVFKDPLFSGKSFTGKGGQHGLNKTRKRFLRCSPG
jgi:hypothetical protein